VRGHSEGKQKATWQPADRAPGHAVHLRPSDPFGRQPRRRPVDARRALRVVEAKVAGAATRVDHSQLVDAAGLEQSAQRQQRRAPVRDQRLVQPLPQWVAGRQLLVPVHRHPQVSRVVPVPGRKRDSFGPRSPNAPRERQRCLRHGAPANELAARARADQAIDALVADARVQVHLRRDREDRAVGLRRRVRREHQHGPAARGSAVELQELQQLAGSRIHRSSECCRALVAARQDGSRRVVVVLPQHLIVVDASRVDSHEAPGNHKHLVGHQPDDALDGSLPFRAEVRRRIAQQQAHRDVSVEEIFPERKHSSLSLEFSLWLCPEPALVKRSFSCINGSKRPFSLTSCLLAQRWSPETSPRLRTYYTRPTCRGTCR
jgi:hypothetical protein